MIVSLLLGIGVRIGELYVFVRLVFLCDSFFFLPYFMLLREKISNSLEIYPYYFFKYVPKVKNI